MFSWESKLFGLFRRHQCSLHLISVSSLQLSDQCSCLSPCVSSDIFPLSKTSIIQKFLPNPGFICVVIRRINTRKKRRRVHETEGGVLQVSNSFRLQQKFQECHHLPVCMQTMKKEKYGDLMVFYGKSDYTVKQVKHNASRMNSNTQISQIEQSTQ